MLRFFIKLKQRFCLHRDIEYDWSYRNSGNKIVHISTCKNCKLQFIIEDNSIIRIK